jgi:predicted amidophosphoribosyltransferase
LRARGYNQSVLLAHAVGQRSGVKLVRDALVRLRPTQSLGELSADQRKALISGVVALRKGRGDAVRGQHVVLVDDVLTSGATASGCTRALLAAGARRVDVLVAARVPDPRLR